MFRKNNSMLYVCLLAAIIILAATTVSAQDMLPVAQTAEEIHSAAPTAIVVQTLEVERSPLEWVLVLQGAVLLFLFTLLTLNSNVRDRMLERVRVRNHYNLYDA